MSLGQQDADLAIRGPLAEGATACEDCGAKLGADARAGRCPTCAVRARARYRAGAYASEARPGLVVHEGLVEPFAWFLPAALARRGLALERRGVEWIVRSAS